MARRAYYRGRSPDRLAAFLDALGRFVEAAGQYAPDPDLSGAPPPPPEALRNARDESAIDLAEQLLFAWEDLDLPGGIDAQPSPLGDYFRAFWQSLQAMLRRWGFAAAPIHGGQTWGLIRPPCVAAPGPNVAADEFAVFDGLRRILSRASAPSPAETEAARRGAGADGPDLTSCQRDLLEVIAAAEGRLVTDGVFLAMNAAGKIHGESTIKNALRDLVKFELLTNCKGCRPRGYGLPSWPCPHQRSTV